jgi:hypothetical protein
VLNQLKLEQAQQLSSLDTNPGWEALKQWADDTERLWAISTISGLQPNESSEAWDRKVSQARGVMMALKLLLKLPEDARAIVEQEARKAAIRESSGIVG